MLLSFPAFQNIQVYSRYNVKWDTSIELSMNSLVNLMLSGSKHSEIYSLNSDNVRLYQNVKNSVILMMRNLSNGLLYCDYGILVWFEWLSECIVE